jgi:hypothetical protein
MSHQRQTIREALVTMLSGNTDAGTEVYANRAAIIWREELPLIQIFTRNETATRRSINSQQSIRTLTLSVEVFAEANDNLDDTLDTISKQIEDIIAANPSLSGTANGSLLTDTEINLDSVGEKLVGKLTLTFETKYIE